MRKIEKIEQEMNALASETKDILARPRPAKNTHFDGTCTIEITADTHWGDPDNIQDRADSLQKMLEEWGRHRFTPSLDGSPSHTQMMMNQRRAGKSWLDNPSLLGPLFPGAGGIIRKVIS